jgi:ABC-type branched-subunit amino acid transport system ATPase component
MSSRVNDVIEVEHVTHRFGKVAAVSDCSWALQRGSITALIGPNGAGKTTLANLLAGSLTVQEGRVRCEGADITGWPPDRIARQGIIRTFQISRDFKRLTLFENMLVAVRDQPGESLIGAFFRRAATRAAETKNVARAAKVLEQFGLYELRNERASDISGGQKRLLELARAAMAAPKVLLLDEPMAGINPVLITRICMHLKQMQEEGVTLLLIEHNLSVVEEICESVTVMVEGRVLTTGSMAELRRHPDVIDAYLGREVSGLAAS